MKLRSNPHFPTEIIALSRELGILWRELVNEVTNLANGTDYMLEVAKGNVAGHSVAHVFGHANNGIQTTVTDVWDRADSVATQNVWIAPTAARVHAIVSSSASDDGNPVGVGARTIRIWGLTSWSSAEVTEDITLNGTTPVNTVNSYVIIHRMRVLTSGATSINVGAITATAATDSTVTAVIKAGIGQTEMAIYGIPSTQIGYICFFDGALNNATAQSRIDSNLVVNYNPDVQTTNFVTIAHLELQNGGTSNPRRSFCAPYKIAGPVILKINGTGSEADMDMSTSMDLILVNN